MLKLNKSLDAWQTTGFIEILKEEVRQLGVNHLPLQQGLSSGSYALGNKLDVMYLSSTEKADSLQIRIAVFYTSIIAGCNCADDPTPVDEQSEYCEVLLDINKASAETEVSLLVE